MVLSGSYIISLVLLSILTATIAAFAAFGIAERSTSAAQKKHKITWVLFGALSMGIGIWAMHFIGMLAFELPIPVSYNLEITLVSILPAFFSSGIILWMMSQRAHSRRQLLLSGIFMGSGIGLMHHTGMAAMRMDAVMIHDKTLSLLSILFAIIASTVALKIQQETANLSNSQIINKRKVFSALVMGLAISGMHYSAMGAVSFAPKSNNHTVMGVSSGELAIVVSTGVFAIILVSIFAPLLLRYKQTVKELGLSVERLRLANKTAQQGSFEIDLQTGVMQTSEDYAVLLGYESGEFANSLEAYLQEIHPDDREQAQATLEEALKEGKPLSAEYRRKTKDGRWLWICSTGEVAEWDDNHKPLRMIGIHRSINSSKKSTEVLRALAEASASESENIFRKIVYQLATSHGMRYAMISLINSKDPSQAETLAVWAGDQFAENISYSLKGSPCEKVIQEELCFYPQNIQALFPEDCLLADMEVESYLGAPLRNSQNKVIGIINMLDDEPIEDTPQTSLLLKSLATRASIELERLESEKKLELSSRVFSDTHEGITITEADGTIIDVNPAFCEITGYNREEIIGKNPRVLRSDQQDANFYAEMWQTLEKLGHWKGEIWNRKKNGEIYAELLTISALKNDQGQAINYVGIFSDITHTKEQQKELELMAHYDVLTKLPNRALFHDRFSQAVAHSRRTETLLAVCFLDLDNFKPVNDSYGHSIGDRLLIEVAERIKANIREEDTVSRQGGDEFTLLLGDIETFAPCEQVLKRMLSALSKPYQIDDQIIDISASLGVTLYPKDAGDIDTLTRHADQAMYQAKLAGKNRFHLYNPELDQQVTLKHQKREAIQQALTNDEFRLYYQPKVNMKTGKVYGAEALIRWLHPEKGMIPPLGFLPFIEETALEIQLGEWVIDQALSQAAIWESRGISLEISVNIASYHLQSAHFTRQLEMALLKQPSVNPANLQLEVLESSVLGDAQVISRIIKSCQDRLGVKVALDDFGTGYSSLTHLRNLPAETIKIDQTFVRDMLDDPDDCAIIDGIIGLADSFDRTVIAEGVETTEHGLMLLLMGCDHAQGYGIARPMPAEMLPEWLGSYTANETWLACGNSEYSHKERRLQQLSLATKQWEKQLEMAIQSVPDQLQSWPIMDKTKCPFGRWLNRENHEQLYNAEWLKNLAQAHDQVHSVADSLTLLYHGQELKSAREQLSLLKAQFAKIEALIAEAIQPG